MLRAIFGTDNALKVVNPAVNAIFPDWYTSSGMPILAGGLRLTNACIDQDGWITGLGTNLETQVPFGLSGYFLPAAKQITIGFRFKTLVKTTGNSQFLTLMPESAPRSVTDYLVLTSAAWMLDAAVNDEMYVEVTYTRATGLIKYSVNGVSFSEARTLTLSAATASAWDAGTLGFNFRLSGIGAVPQARYAIRDIVVIDDISGDGITGPIGQVRTYPLQTVSAVGDGWAPSSGNASLTDTLNLPPPGDVIVTTSGNQTPLVANVSSTLPQNAKIIGVALAMAGQSLTISSAQTKVELSGQSVTLSPKSVSIKPPPMTWGVSLGVYSKAFDGSNWTAAKISAVSIKIMSDNAT